MMRVWEEEMRARSRLLGYARLTALYAGMVMLVWWARPTRTWLWVGLVPLVAGEAVRWWAAGHLLKSKELVTSGPYAYTQNPLYLGRLLILVGLGVMCTLPWKLNWLALAVGLGGFYGYYLPRKLRVEGARLESKHGERWKQYRRSVPILFPTTRRYPGTEPQRWSWERMVRNREYVMLLGLGVLVLLLWLRLPS
ncbi:MAG: isoprenylcysteine carboxylmethyltransferase family protein [Acidobacteriota bacterium]